MPRTPRFLYVLLLLVALQPLCAFAEKAPPNATLTGHQSPALAVTFSPDGSRLASVADDNLLKIWDLETKKELFSLPGLKQNQNQIRFTPDGKTIVAMGSDNNLVVFDAVLGKPRKPIAITNLPGGVLAIDLSPDGKTVAAVGRGTLRLFDLATGAIRQQYEVHPDHAASAVAFSHDGRRITTAGSDNTALVLETATGKVVRKFELGANGEQVVFPHDGKSILVYCNDRVIRSCDVESGAIKKLVDKGYPFRTLAVSHDGKTLILGGAGSGPWLLALADGVITDDAYGSDDRTNCAAISNDGKWIAGGGNEGAVYLWKTGK